MSWCWMGAETNETSEKGTGIDAGTGNGRSFLTYSMTAAGSCPRTRETIGTAKRRRWRGREWRGSCEKEAQTEQEQQSDVKLFGSLQAQMGEQSRTLSLSKHKLFRREMLKNEQIVSSEIDDGTVQLQASSTDCSS